MKKPAMPSSAFIFYVFTILLSVEVSAQGPRQRVRDQLEERYVLPIRRDFDIDGLDRSALVFIPKDAGRRPLPVVLCFHGSGGNAQKAAGQFSIHKHWSEAIVIYLNGLPREVRGDVKPGWVLEIDEQGNNREIAFVEGLLKEIGNEVEINEQAVFAAGHSNGGFLCYLLWQQRSDLFAAFAPCACFSRVNLEGVPPKPIFHAAGRKDPLVPIAKQIETIEKVKEINEVGDGIKGKRPGMQRFPSENGMPVVTFLHPRGHEYPEELGAMVSRFFEDIANRSGN